MTPETPKTLGTLGTRDHPTGETVLETGRSHVDARIIELVRAERAARGDGFPRFVVLLFDCDEPDAVRKCLDRIPEAIDGCIEEIVLMLSQDAPRNPGKAPRRWTDDIESIAGSRSFTLRVHQPPLHRGHGALRKAGFEYALRGRFDCVIVMRADVHPPEKLPELLLSQLEDPDRLVLATRQGAAGVGPRGLAHRASTFFQNHALGLRIADYHASFRAYPVQAIERIPFQLGSNSSAFDAEILLQFRALGVPIHEAPLSDGQRGDGSGCDSIGHSLRSCATAIGYRSHQIHLTRNGRYFVDHDAHYTLKLSDTSSHMQIVESIAAGSRVLDLGCSQGLLARPLKEKKVAVVGVDVGQGQRLASELDEYHQRDLEEPLELPTQRIFDYVVCADVIEHLRNRQQLLRSARRYLKEDGRLIISTPNIAIWFYRLSLLVGRFEYGPRGVLDETHVHLFTGASFRREVERAGFRVVRQRVTALPFEVLFESTGRSRFVRQLASTYHQLARLWPSMFAYQFVLEAEITTLDEESTLSESGEPGESSESKPG